MPNISETVRETFTKLSGFLGVIPEILYAKYGGDMTTQFWGKRWESWNLYLQNWRSGGLDFFVQLEFFEYSKIKTLASGPPVKGSPEKILSVSKNFSETNRQIFPKIWAFFEVIHSIPCAKYAGDLTTQFLGVEKLIHLNARR